jgi:HisJ family histidinol phosphate phosphatase
MSDRRNRSLPNYDLHIHTVYSGHSEESMYVRDIVEYAQKKSLQTIALTEHFRDPIMDAIHFEKISAEAAAMKSNSDSMRILTGMEADPNYDRRGKIMGEEIETESLFPVLVGVHRCFTSSYGWNEAREISKEEARREYAAWFDTMEKIALLPQVQVFAHPGRFITKNGGITDFSGFVLKDFERLFLAMKEGNVAFELNESFLRQIEGSAFGKSYSQVVESAFEHGLFFTMGSDAHSMKNIGSFPCAERFVSSLPFLPFMEVEELARKR